MAFEKYRSEIIRELKAILRDDSPLSRMLRYHVGWADENGKPVTKEYPGKLLRPGFCLMSCEAVGGDWRTALPAAASIELMHDFSLIHDDIEDCSPYRRHQRTLWAVWGGAMAINAGDAMHTLAEIAMLGLSERGVPPERVIEALKISNEACLRLCQGQHLDLSYEKRLDINLADYLKMIAGKTAALFECAFRLGALLGDPRRAAIDKLGACGHYLGLAFQVKDDVLGIWGGKDTGKPAESDLLKRKKTLPVVYALEQTKGSDRRYLLTYYRKEEPSNEDIVSIREVLERVGAREYSKRVGMDYYAKALQELKDSGLKGEALQGLIRGASQVVERGF